MARHRALTVTFSSFSEESFAAAIGSFSEQIREATDLVIHKTLLCDFTTTTPAVRIASEVALMDSFSSYFEYLRTLICGIPAITLQGTVEDWESIRARVEVLATFDLEWWVSRLRPILDEFVRTSRGKPNREFWQAIYKPAEAYAAELVTGWIVDLFPYLGDAPERKRNLSLNSKRRDWLLDAEDSPTTKSFPSGLSSVPVKLNALGVPSGSIELVAGFFAVKQNAEDLSLSPLISWAVTEPPPNSKVRVTR